MEKLGRRRKPLGRSLPDTGTRRLRDAVNSLFTAIDEYLDG